MLCAMAGLAALLIDVRSGTVETLLPDALGFALLAVAMHLLAPLDAWFRAGRLVALAGVAAGLVTLVDRSRHVGYFGDVPYYWDPQWPVTLGEMVLDAAAVWLLAGGLRRQAERRGRFSVATPAQLALAVYLPIAAFRIGFQALEIYGVAGGHLVLTRLRHFVTLPLALFHIVGGFLLLEVLWVSLRKRREFLTVGIHRGTEKS